MARMFSKLVREELPGSNPVVAAMRSRPDLIGGPEAVDTRIMLAIPGAIAKRGAEGVMCVGLPDWTGVALKVEDGANRATGPALAAYLGIEELARLPIKNSRGEPVGEIFAE
jgi:L-asparaginase II